MAFHRNILEKSINLLSRVFAAENNNLSPSFKANFVRTLNEYALKGDETKKAVLIDISKITATQCVNQYSKNLLKEFENLIKEEEE